MSTNHPSEPPPTGPSPRRWLRYLSNVGIVFFFVVGAGVAAGSFGLFGCWCTDGFTRREKPLELPVKDGDGPPAPKREEPTVIF